MDLFGLFPLRQMPRTFDLDQPAVWERFHDPFAVFERDRIILFTPNHKYRPRVLTNASQLVHLIDIAIADDLRQTGAAESLVLHLIAVAFRPVGKTLWVQEVAELTFGPVTLVEHSCQVVPHRRQVFDERELVRL